MQATRQSSVIDAQESEIDAGLKSLQIDRSVNQPYRTRHGSRRGTLYALGLLVVVAAGWLAYRRVTAATEVETMRVPASSSFVGEIAGATILNATGYIVAAQD